MGIYEERKLHIFANRQSRMVSFTLPPLYPQEYNHGSPLDRRLRVGEEKCRCLCWELSPGRVEYHLIDSAVPRHNAYATRCKNDRFHFTSLNGVTF
jgi:hypothetical protein